MFLVKLNKKVYGLLLCAMLATPLAAEVAILPFRITGSPDPLYYARDTLPVDLQEATHFLFETTRNYPLQSTQKVNQALRELNWAPSELLDSNRADRICLKLNSVFLLSGTIQFIKGGNINVRVNSYSCQARRSHATVDRTGSGAKLQSLLRSAIQQATPFAGLPHQQPPFRNRAAVDLAVILDSSGSMSEDLPAIELGLAALSDRLPTGSRLSIIQLRNQKESRILPFTSEFSEVKSFLAGVKPYGEVDINQTINALQMINDFGDWKGRPALMVFTDARFTKSSFNRIRSLLRRLKKTNIKINLYGLKMQSPEDSENWERIARSLSLNQPVVVYGQRAGYLDGSAYYFIRSGRKFFRSSENLTKFISENRLTTEELIPLNLLTKHRVTPQLEELPQLFAVEQRTKLLTISPLLSGLERKIVNDIIPPAAGQSTPYRVLVKNRKESFWVGLDDEQLYKKLISFGKQRFYLGLRFRHRPNHPEDIINHPTDLYIRIGTNTPLLFVNGYNRLRLLPPSLLDENDVWFLLVEIKGFRDVHREHDIRE